MDRYCLPFITIVVNNTSSEHIKWSAKENIICWVPKDVNLHVESDVTKLEGYIAG